MHRYYDPDTGRYLTPDPIGLAGGINPFVYSHNNPVNYIDPYGLQSIAIPGSPFPIILPKTEAQKQADKRIADGIYSAMKKAEGQIIATYLNQIVSIVDIINLLNEKTEDGESCDKKKNQRGNDPKGEPGTWSEHPHGKQDRFYGPDGTPMIDIDYGHDHGQGQPHVHPWKDGVRGPGYPL